jgi:hypothetical protein
LTSVVESTVGNFSARRGVIKPSVTSRPHILSNIVRSALSCTETQLDSAPPSTRSSSHSRTSSRVTSLGAPPNQRKNPSSTTA